MKYGPVNVYTVGRLILAAISDSFQTPGRQIALIWRDRSACDSIVPPISNVGMVGLYSLCTEQGGTVRASNTGEGSIAVL